MHKGSMIVLVLLIVMSAGIGAAPAQTSVRQADGREWAIGVSAISPGLPIALKVVWQRGSWGAQFEANYFYMWAMARVDGRRTIVTRGRLETYGCVGLTFNHFNDGLGTAASVNDTFWADLAAGVQWNIGKRERFSLGAEGGLMIPFYSNLGLEQYQNTGFMVANVFILWWL